MDKNTPHIFKLIIGWRDEKLRPQAHRDRWDRCLVLLGESGLANRKDAVMPEEELKRLASRPWGGRWKQVLKYYEDAGIVSKTIEVTTSAPNDDSTHVQTVAVTNNAPDYESDYKDACRIINELRSQISDLKTGDTRTLAHNLKMANEYGERQKKRADDLEAQVKDSVARYRYDNVLKRYDELAREGSKMNEELLGYKAGKITYNQAINAIKTNAIVDGDADMLRGCEKLNAEDVKDIELLKDRMTLVMQTVKDLWLWDITHVPAGRIGERYKGKSYDADMGMFVHGLDGMSHSVWQMAWAINDMIDKMEKRRSNNG